MNRVQLGQSEPSLPTGIQTARASALLATNPRLCERGFSFAGYRYAYYFTFCNTPPFCAVRQVPLD